MNAPTHPLCAVCSNQHPEHKFLPIGIDEYRDDVLKNLEEDSFNDKSWKYPVISNIAYNLQYLEYLNKCFEEQYLTSVLRAQNMKMFTLTSTQIIECLLYVKLVEMGVHKDDIWDFARSIRVATEKNVYGLGSIFYRNDLMKLKNLRNKIHLQTPTGMREADYLVFEKVEMLNDVKRILKYCLQRVLKLDTATFEEKFYFLAPTKDFVHSIA